LKDALNCEATGKAPNPKLRMKCGEVGIVAMVQGPGKHLKWAPNGLMGGIVKAEEFDYFHELIVQEERGRCFCPGYED